MSSIIDLVRREDVCVGTIMRFINKHNANEAFNEALVLSRFDLALNIKENYNVKYLPGREDEIIDSWIAKGCEDSELFYEILKDNIDSMEVIRKMVKSHKMNGIKSHTKSHVYMRIIDDCGQMIPKDIIQDMIDLRSCSMLYKLVLEDILMDIPDDIEKQIINKWGSYDLENYGCKIIKEMKSLVCSCIYHGELKNINFVKVCRPEGLLDNCIKFNRHELLRDILKTIDIPKRLLRDKLYEHSEEFDKVILEHLNTLLYSPNGV